MMRDAVVHRVEIRLERKKLSFRCAIDLVLALDLRQPTRCYELCPHFVHTVHICRGGEGRTHVTEC
jgi:hypothetical protein